MRAREETKWSGFKYICKKVDMNTFSLLPGQSLSLHGLFKSPVHSLPPYFAEIEIFLCCVPFPHDSLQLDHGDKTQSTKFGINQKFEMPVNTNTLLKVL